VTDPSAMCTCGHRFSAHFATTRRCALIACTCPAFAESQENRAGASDEGRQSTHWLPPASDAAWKLALGQQMLLAAENHVELAALRPRVEILERQVDGLDDRDAEQHVQVLDALRGLDETIREIQSELGTCKRKRKKGKKK
jgi:hypothetical protein